jgi:5-formyltetrahydrofolate cyclo-ligase
VDDARRAAPDKQSLRADLLAVRRDRPADALAAARAAIRSHVLDRVDGMTVVAAYIPLRTEPGSVELLAALAARGIRVLVPVTLPDRDLDWTAWSPSGDASGLGRDAIATAGLVLVPALAVARDGTRLGRGGGSYDRALARCAPDAVTVALAFEGEIVDRLPRDPWDVAVSAAVTPSGWVPLDRNTDIGFHR